MLAHLGFLGSHRGPAANASTAAGDRRPDHVPGATVALVVPTDEELVIARDTAALATD